MSCDGNRTKFFRNLAAQPSVAAFLGPEADEQHVVRAFEQLFNTARNQPESDAQHLVAQMKTRKLFEEIRQHGLRPPTHSESGLPRRDAQTGYAMIYDTLKALREQQPLPDLATTIQQAYRTRRNNDTPRPTAQPPSDELGALDERIQAPVFDKRGVFRCPNCGRFASQVRQHLCPQTANAVTMARHLQRRLKLPPGCYDITQIQHLLNEYETHKAIQMHHPLTHEHISTTLDGSLVALRQGFLPLAWESTTMVQVENNVISVHNPQSLQIIEPSSNLIQHLGVANGVVINEEDPVFGLDTEDVPSRVRLVGGNTYSFDELTAYEYGNPQGTIGPYQIGETITGPQTINIFDNDTRIMRDPEHGEWVVLREQYYEDLEDQDWEDWEDPYQTYTETTPATPADYSRTLGRTYLKVLDLLTSTRLHTNQDGIAELYTSDGSQLLAIYDPTSRTTATTQATTSDISPEQLAVLLAYHTKHSRFEDKLQYLRRSFLSHDLQQSTAVHPLSYLGNIEKELKRIFEHSPKLNAQHNAPRCPECGRWRGSVHVCPRTDDLWSNTHTSRMLYLDGENREARLEFASAIHSFHHAMGFEDVKIREGPLGYEVYADTIGTMLWYDPSTQTIYQEEETFDIASNKACILTLIAHHYAQTNVRLRNQYQINAQIRFLTGDNTIILSELLSHVQEIKIQGVVPVKCQQCGENISQPHRCPYPEQHVYHETLLNHFNTAHEEDLEHIFAQDTTLFIRYREQQQQEQQTQAPFSSIGEALVPLQESNRFTTYEYQFLKGDPRINIASNATPS